MRGQRFRAFLNALLLNSSISKLEKKIVVVRKQKEDAIDKMFSKFKENKESREDYMQNVSGEERKAFNKAADLRKHEQRILMAKRSLELIQKSYIWIVIVLLSLMIQSLRPDLGPNISIGYYSTLSQIFPIVLIALYMASTRTKITKKLFKVNYQTLRLMTVVNDGFHGITSVIIGTAVCLVVIASNISNTFEFLITLGCLVMVVFALLQNLAQD